MRKVVCSLLGLSATCLVPSVTRAQDSAPPKIMVIEREFLKPGKAGELHDKSESAFVQAFMKAKWPTHYLAATSVSGKSRALFFLSYDSFDAWEKDLAAQAKEPTLAAAVERAENADGELLESVDTAVLVYEPDLSLRPRFSDPKRRALEISSYHVKPGHYADWAELVKLVRSTYEKSDPDAHWGCFRLQYGGLGDTYFVLTGLRSASEIDAGFEKAKEFDAALGENGLRRLEELVAAAIDSSQHELFVYNPRMSYPTDDYIKADDFWAPKPEPATKAVAEKPGKKTGQ
jgi:hypothetical protein